MKTANIPANQGVDTKSLLKVSGSQGDSSFSLQFTSTAGQLTVELARGSRSTITYESSSAVNEQLSKFLTDSLSSGVSVTVNAPDLEKGVIAYETVLSEDDFQLIKQKLFPEPEKITIVVKNKDNQEQKFSLELQFYLDAHEVEIDQKATFDSDGILERDRHFFIWNRQGVATCYKLKVGYDYLAKKIAAGDVKSLSLFKQVLTEKKRSLPEDRKLPSDDNGFKTLAGEGCKGLFDLFCEDLSEDECDEDKIQQAVTKTNQLVDKLGKNYLKEQGKALETLLPCFLDCLIDNADVSSCQPNQENGVWHVTLSQECFLAVKDKAFPVPMYDLFCGATLAFCGMVFYFLVGLSYVTLPMAAVGFAWFCLASLDYATDEKYISPFFSYITGQGDTVDEESAPLFQA